MIALHFISKLLGVVGPVDVDADRLVGVIDIHQKEVLSPIDVGTGIAGLAGGFELRVTNNFNKLVTFFTKSKLVCSPLIFG